MKLLTDQQRRVLISHHTSHANKMAFVAEYVNRGFFVETDWDGDVRERAAFRFEPAGSWHIAHDYLNDVMRLYEG